MTKTSNKPISIAVVGLGYVGKKYFEMFHMAKKYNLIGLDAKNKCSTKTKDVLLYHYGKLKDVLKVQNKTPKEQSQILQRMSCELYEKLASFAPLKPRTEIEGYMQKLCKGILKTGEVKETALHDLFKSKYANAPQRLFKAVGSYLGMPYSPYVDTSKVIYDYAFICVPTPMAKDDSCDIRAVIDAIQTVRAKVYCIKSTVAVGTTDYLSSKYKKNIVFSPEYCGESSYDNSYDFHTAPAKTPWVILGGKDASSRLLYNLLLPIVGPEKKWFFLTAKEAEMTKYMENSYFATKIAYCNELFDICLHSKIDFYKVREAWLADPRINRMHTAVFEGKRGYSGKCLPKDTNALIAFSEKFGYIPKILNAVKEYNESLLRQNERNR